MWGCIVNNSYPRHCMWWFTRKNLITFTDGCTIQGKCQKDSHDSESTCGKEQRSEHDGFTDGCMCGEMMESPSQMSLYHLIFRDIKSNNLKQPQMMLSHLVRMFMFVVIKYKQIQNKHLPL